MAVILRAMQERDVRAVAELAEAGFREIYPFDWLANAQALLAGCEQGRVFVAIAEIQQQAVGYSNLRAWPGGGWIDQVVVRPDQQRKGVGRRLVERVLDEAAGRGFWKVSLIVSETEGGVLAFYNSCGFEREGLMKDQIRRGTDGILLSHITDYNLHPNG